MGFEYTADLRDSDASNARSAAFRFVRDSQEWEDKEEKKAIHAEAGATARKVVMAIEKGLNEHTKRDKWDDEQTTKAHRLMAEKGVESYSKSLIAAGCEIDKEIIEGAMRAYEQRLVSRRAEQEATAAVNDGMNYDDIFGKKS